MGTLSAPEPLGEPHDLSHFNSGLDKPPSAYRKSEAILRAVWLPAVPRARTPHVDPADCRTEGNTSGLGAGTRWLAWPPVPRQLLSRGNLPRRHHLFQPVKPSGSLIIIPRRCEAEPHIRLNVIAWDALAVVIHHTEVELGPCIPLFCGLSIPADGGLRIARDAVTVAYIRPRLYWPLHPPVLRLSRTPHALV